MKILRNTAVHFWPFITFIERDQDREQDMERTELSANSREVLNNIFKHLCKRQNLLAIGIVWLLTCFMWLQAFWNIFARGGNLLVPRLDSDRFLIKF